MSQHACVFASDEDRLEALAALARAEFDGEIACAATSRGLIRACRDAAFVLVDERHVDDTVRLVRKTADASTEVVVLGSDSSVGALAYYEVGATQFVSDGDDDEAVREAIRAARGHQTRLDVDEGRRVVRRLQELYRLCGEEGIDPTRCRTLTPRQRDVCRLLAEGLTNAEIADELGIEPGTVKTHVHDILTALDVDDREMAGAYWRIFVDGEQGSG